VTLFIARLAGPEGLELDCPNLRSPKLRESADREPAFAPVAPGPVESRPLPGADQEQALGAWHIEEDRYARVEVGAFAAGGGGAAIVYLFCAAHPHAEVGSAQASVLDVQPLSDSLITSALPIVATA
jgi:hypothetical protein